MRNLFTCLSKKSFASENGLKTDREWTDEVAEKSARMSTVWAMLWVKLVNLVNLVMQFLKATKRQSDTTIFAENLKNLKCLMQIFVESAESAKSAKSAKPIFATFATFASANFVGKESNESTVRYRVKSRIPSCLFRYSLDPNLSRFSLASLICLCMLTVGVSNVWGGDVTFTREDFTNTSGTNSASKSDVTISCVGNIPNKKSYITFTEGNTLTISTTSGNITAIDFTCVSDDYTGNLSDVSGISTSSWSLSVDNPGAKTTVQVTSIVVTVSAGCSGIKLGSPTVSAVPSGGQVVLTWPAVSNASSYAVTCKNTSSGSSAGSVGSVTGTSTKTCTVSSLTNGTSYTFSVKAIGDGDDYCDGNATEVVRIAGSSYTVTWKVNGETYETTYIYTGGTKNLVLPSNPSSCMVGKEFAGWSASTIAGTTDTKPTFVSSQTIINANQTYHAVFATKTANSYSLGDVNDLYPGQKVLIVNQPSGTAMSNSGSSGSLTATGVSISSSKITSMSTSSLIWTVENSGTKFKFKNGHYVYAYSTNTNTSLYCDNDGDGGVYAADAWTATNTGTAGYYYLYSDRSTSAKKLEYYSSTFTTYGYNSTYDSRYTHSFFVPTYTGYITSCCTDLGYIKGSVSWSNGSKATLVWDKDANATGYVVKWKTHAGAEGTYATTNVSSINDTLITKKTCAISSLTAGTEYDFKIFITGKTSPTVYCDKDSVMTVKAPKITATTDANLVEATYAEGSGPSTNASYFTFSGVGLTGDVTVTAPTNFLVSKTSSSSGFDGSVTVSPSTGSITDQKIWICLASGLTNASSPYGGNVALSGGSAASVNVAVTGSVSSACTAPTVATPTLTSIASGTITVSCASITVDDNCDLSEYGFVWKASSDPAIGDNKNAIATSYADNFSKALSISFTTGNTYKIKAFGTNVAGTTLSPSLTVTPQSVAFNMNGHGSQVATQYVNNGSKASEPSAPSASYYTFNGWKLSGSAYNFSTATVTSDITLDADWSVIPVTALTLNYSTLKRYVGESDVTLSVSSVTPNTANPAVTWSSSDATVASVDGGVVSFLKAGTATITATSTVSGSITATCSVEVRSISSPTMQDEDGTTISGSGLSATWTLGTRTLTASEGTSKYKFKRWIVTNATPASTTNLSTTLGDPTGNVTVVAEFYKPRTVKWSVNSNDSYTAGGATTTVAYNGTISTIPTAPSGLVCASTFVAWTDAAHNNGTTAKASTSYYESKLFTAANQFPNITAETTTFYAVFAEGTGAAVNTVMWSEDWTGATYSDGSTGMDAAKPSAQGSHTGKTVYGSATVTYSETDAEVYARNDNTAKGAGAPELLIKSNKAWTISGIPTGGAVTLTLSFITNKSSLGTLTVATAEDGKTPTISGSITGSSAPYSGSYTITTDGASTINITFGNTSNTRLDDIDVKVASVSLTNYVTECDGNIVSVTYNANGGSTSCTNTTTDKTEDFTVCATEPTRDYYTFDGWLCSADDEVYAANATIDDAVIDDDFTLTAQWTPVPYSITYELDGGTNNVGNPATYNVTTATITLQDPTKGHDRFEGWYDNGSFTGDAVTSIPVGSHGDITLYAKWAERHEIIFDADGTKTTIYRADDENMEDAVAGQGSVPDNPDAPSACSSKVFVGWSESTIDDETDTEPADLTNATGTVSADKHYYAVWATESSETGTVTVFADSLKIAGTDAVTSRSGWSSISNVAANSGDGVKLSSKSNAANMTVDLSSKSLESTLIITFQVKQYSDESGYIAFACLDDESTASFSPSSISSITDATWTNKTCTVSTVNAATQSITLSGQANARVYMRNFEIKQTGTIYSYSAYATSCCATNVTLSQNDPEHGAIAFGKTKVGTCGDQDVTLTITPAAGYQLHSYEVATGSGKVATNSVSPTISLDNNSSAAQNITLTFADKADGAYDVTASFTLMTVTSWTWTLNSAAIPDPLNLYVGQNARLDVAYTPSGVDASKKTYGRTKDDAYINFGGGSYTNYTTISGKASTGENTTAVTFTHADGPTKTVNVKVLPLPLTHFEDLVHGKAFADVVATISDNALSATKTTPTSDDWTTPNANDCESDHLHLVGWIREDWPALVAYLNGTGDAPATTAIVGAGNDDSGNAYFFAPNASINVQTFDGVTFYAVWAEIK